MGKTALKRIFPAAIAVVVFISACVKDNFNLKKIGSSFWKPDVAVPIVNSSLSLQEIMALQENNGIFNVGPDNFITLIYRGTLFSLKASDFVKIPDQLLTHQLAIDNTAATLINNLPLSGSVNLPPFTQLFDFNQGNNVAYIDSVILRNGVITLGFTSSLQHELVITANIPGATKNGVAFSHQITVPPAGASPVQSSASFGLNDYHLRLFEGAQKNKLRINFTVGVTKIGAPVSVADFIDVRANFSSLNFMRLHGNVGQQSLAPYTDSVKIGLFDNVFGNSAFTLAEGTMKINIRNAFGIPIEGRFSRLQGYMPQSAIQTLNIVGTGIPDPLSIPVPASLGNTGTSSFVLTNLNSNIVDVLGSAPRQIIYKIDAESNPSSVPAMENFITDTSRFRVDMDIDLPLNGAIKNLTFQDTIQFRFQDVDELESLSLRTYIKNGFPLGMDVQVYFADTLGRVVDSLMGDDRVILSPASVGIDGRVNSFVDKTTDINYPAEKIARLGKVRQIFIKARTNTYNNGNTNVKVYADYLLDVKISARAKLKFDL